MRNKINELNSSTLEGDSFSFTALLLVYKSNQRYIYNNVLIQIHYHFYIHVNMHRECFTKPKTNQKLIEDDSTMKCIQRDDVSCKEVFT